MSDRGPLLRWVVIGAAGIGAGTLALTTPKDDTRFVSVRPPSVKSHRAPVGSAVHGTAGAAALAPSSPEVPGALARAGRGRGSGGYSPGPSPDSAASYDAAPGGTVASRDTDAGAVAPLPEPGASERRDLFRPLVVAKPARALPPASLPPMPADGFLPLPDGGAAGGKRQRSYWQYVGTVQLDGVNYALVEEKKSKTGVYLKRGDEFRGGRVEVLQRDYLVLSMGGRRYTLPKASGLSEEPAGGLTPAAAPATAPAGTPAPGTPPAPGAPGTPGAVPYTPGAPYPGGYVPPQGWPGAYPGAYPQPWPGVPPGGWPTVAPSAGAWPGAYPSDDSFRIWRRRRRD